MAWEIIGTEHLMSALDRAQRYGRERGLCGDVGPFRHLCTRWAGHDGQHNGVRVEDGDERVTAAWGG
jgi:hypothetical protein